MTKVEFWHRRYTQQAAWTRDLRQHLYRKCHLSPGGRVLDAGCGTGALLGEAAQTWGARTFGVDIDLTSLRFAAGRIEKAMLFCGDVLRLPCPSGVFDLSICHFLLLWLADPLQGLAELRRVTRAGGALLVLAEPDYGGRIDYPPDLAELGALQREALGRQGADACLGRRLHALMHAAGFSDVETGVLGGAWSDAAPPDHALEWDVLEQDLKDSVPCDKIMTLRRRDERAWENGERILFVPTFFSLGRVT